MSVAESILCRSNGVQLGYFGIFCRANIVLWDNPGTICTLCGAAQKTCHRNISSKIAPVVNSIVDTTVVNIIVNITAVNTEHCTTTECQMTLLDTCLCLQTKWAFAHHLKCVCHFVETWQFWRFRRWSNTMTILLISFIGEPLAVLKSYLVGQLDYHISTTRDQGNIARQWVNKVHTFGPSYVVGDRRGGDVWKRWWCKGAPLPGAGCALSENHRTAPPALDQLLTVHLQSTSDLYSCIQHFLPLATKEQATKLYCHPPTGHPL